MSADKAKVTEVLHEVGELHGRVYRIVNGADDDWASWYSDWLVNLSELPQLLGVRIVRSELTYLLVGFDKEHGAGAGWQDYYAARLIEYYAAPGT
ncbi:MAG TPA: hypothetical protein VGM91_05870 [Conexibacter sp.]|jgi:hypothetical protein